MRKGTHVSTNQGTSFLPQKKAIIYSPNNTKFEFIEDKKSQKSRQNNSNFNDSYITVRFILVLFFF
jgi:hypothetical protein